MHERYDAAANRSDRAPTCCARWPTRTQPSSNMTRGSASRQSPPSSRRFLEIRGTLEQTQPNASFAVGFVALDQDETLDQLRQRAVGGSTPGHSSQTRT